MEYSPSPSRSVPHLVSFLGVALLVVAAAAGAKVAEVDLDVANPLNLLTTTANNESNSAEADVDVDGDAETRLLQLRANYGELCVYPRVCHLERAIVCDQLNKLCRCLNVFEVPTIIDGRSLKMAWSSGEGRCLAEGGSLCALDRIQIRDEFGLIHNVLLSCNGGRTCEFVENDQGYRFGVCNGVGGAEIQWSLAVLTIVTVVKLLLGC